MLNDYYLKKREHKEIDSGAESLNIKILTLCAFGAPRGVPWL